MNTRKSLLVLLPVLLLATAAIILLLREPAGGDVSTAGVELLGGAATSRPTAPPAVLPVAEHPDEHDDPLALLAGEPPPAEVEVVAPQGAQRGAVGGTLVDAAGQPVSGEPVWLALAADDWEPEPRPSKLPRLAARETSAADGRFRLPARAGAVYVLHAGGGAFPAVKLDDVHSGDDLRIVLPAPAELAGSVLDAQTGLPVEGARVLALHDGASLLVDALPDGTFSVGPLPLEEVLIGAWAPGYDVAFVGNVAPGQQAATVELQPGRPLQGRLIDRVTEQPLAGGTVRLLLDVEAARPGGDAVPVEHLVSEQVTAAGPDGRFAFELAPTLGFALLCESDGYLAERHDRHEDRKLDEGEEVVVALRPAGAVTGLVLLAADGRPAGGAEVWLESPDGVLARGTTGPAGEFALLPGSWPAGREPARPVHVAARSGDLAARTRVQREEDEQLLQLSPVLPLSVQVLEGGLPAAGAEVAARSKGAVTTQAVAGAEGLVALRHELAAPDVRRVVLQARRGDVESLPLLLDLAEPPGELLVLDLSQGAWLEGTLHGRDGEPVPSARLDAVPAANQGPELRRGSARGDAQGRFRLGPLQAGAVYHLTVQAEGYTDLTLRDLLPGAAPLELVLQPVVRWSGRALQAATGQPHPEFWGQLARVDEAGGRRRERNSGERLHLVPGAPGEFWFELPGPGRYLIHLFARDHVPAHSLEWDFDGRTPPPRADLLLARAAVLELAVQDGRGRPVPGYSVAAVPWEVARDAPAPAGGGRKGAIGGRTDGDGVARLQLGAGGTFRLAGGPGFWFDDLPVGVAPGEPVQRIARLPPTGDVEVRVRDVTGAPLGGAMVELRTARDEQVHAVTRRLRTAPGGDGQVLFEALPPAHYDLVVRRRGYANAQSSLQLTGAGLQRVELTLEVRPEGAEPAGGVPRGGPVGGGGRGGRGGRGGGGG